MKPLRTYGIELIIDLHECRQSKMSRKQIKKYFSHVCNITGVKPCKQTFWDYYWWPMWVSRLMKWDKNDRIWGTSAVQFITTSNITIHTIYNMRQVYINVFSCDNFDHEMLLQFTWEWFGGKIVHHQTLERV